MITMIQATEDNIGIASMILCEAAIWLEQKGQPLWPVEEVSREVLAKRVSQYYICYSDGEPAGTLRFQLEDHELWPEITDNKSTFIHKLAVPRNFAGKGVSTAMLQWAADTTRNIGKNFLRVDFDPSRPALKWFYESFGFIFHSSKVMGDFFVHRYVYNLKGQRGQNLNVD